MPLHPQAASLLQVVASLGDPSIPEQTPDFLDDGRAANALAASALGSALGRQ